MEEDLIINELMAKTSGIDLSEIPMSLRLYNCLRRGGYTTLTDVMIESPDKFLNIRNFGKSCEEELFAIIQFIRNNDRDEIINYCRRKGTLSIQGIKRESDITDFEEKLSEYNKISIAEYLFGKEVDVNSVMFIDNTGEYCEDMLLNEIAFSSRINNALMAYGIKSLKDLSSMPYQTLLQIGGLGKKALMRF